jgi:hypothetical protein
VKVDASRFPSGDIRGEEKPGSRANSSTGIGFSATATNGLSHNRTRTRSRRMDNLRIKLSFSNPLPAGLIIFIGTWEKQVRASCFLIIRMVGSFSHKVNVVSGGGMWRIWKAVWNMWRRTGVNGSAYSELKRIKLLISIYF